MRKRRSDSPWGRLTLEQRKQMDEWRFIDNLSYEEIVKRAGEEFGVMASLSTLTGYFRHRRNELDLGDLGAMETVKERIAMRERLGLGMGQTELELRALRFSAAAAYELSLAEPDKMRVKEVAALLKMAIGHRQMLTEQKMKQRKLELQEFVALMKLKNQEQKKQTKEEFEESLMQTSEILNRVKKKAAEGDGANRSSEAGGKGAAESAVKLKSEEIGSNKPEI